MDKKFINASVYQTRGIAALSSEEPFQSEIFEALRRFYDCDWGFICDEDKKVNNIAMKYNDFILAAYRTSQGEIWITAESQNGICYDTITILFPSEY